MNFKSIILTTILSLTVIHLWAQSVAPFMNPAREFRPGIFWVWTDDLITHKGIKSDLEAFERFGLSGTLVMQVGGFDSLNMWNRHNMPGAIKSMSPEFFDAWKYAAEESHRLGLTIATQCGPGWCHSGGPWIRPEEAVQQIFFNELRLTGNGAPIEIALEQICEKNGKTLSQKFYSERNSKEIQHFQNTPLLLQGFYNLTSELGIYAYPGKSHVKRDEIVNLSPYIKNNMIRWKAPAGNWIIRRYAVCNANAYNRPAPNGGKGLECDKLSKVAVDSMFNGMVGRLLAQSPHLAGNTIQGVEADSWEVGNPDWSPRFKTEFVKDHGYDPTPLLIAYKTETIIESPDISARFRNDMYLTQARLFAENFFSHMYDLCEERGLQFMTEPYNGPFDPIRCGGRTQVPMGEFWVNTDRIGTTRFAASAAHTYGRKVVGAEAFTARPHEGNWEMDFYGLKRVGDLAFCNGVNKMMLHTGALQPWASDVKPGMSMHNWGTIFVPGQTWWEQGRSWTQYLARCQYMLTQGQNIADIAAVAPVLNWYNAIPEGLHKSYNYDHLTEELLCSSLEWDNGFFHLPSGAKYRVLFFQKSHGKIAYEVLRKIEKLVKKGGHVLFQDKPEQSPGLAGYPMADSRVKALSDKLFGSCDGKTVFENNYGKGKVIWMNEIWSNPEDIEARQVRKRYKEKPVYVRYRAEKSPFYRTPATTIQWSAPFVQYMKSIVAPDVEVIKAGGKAMVWGGFDHSLAGERDGEDAIAWVHRVIDNRDVYFVSSQVATTQEAEILFRVSDRIPEIWCPESGKRYNISSYEKVGNRIRVRLPLTPYGSLFVVFKTQSEMDASLPQYGGLPLQTSLPLDLTWNVTFPSGMGAPESAILKSGSLTENEEEGIKYFSGTATYSSTFTVGQQELSSQLILNLGEVKNVAEIEVNGRRVDTLWKPPYRADISSDVHAGENSLVIRVTNTWWNRMVGDELYPDDLKWVENEVIGDKLVEIPDWVWTRAERPSPGRITFTTWRFVNKNSPLIPSGLIGPVVLEVCK